MPSYYNNVITDSLTKVLKEQHEGDKEWTADSISKYIAKNYDTYEMAKGFRAEAVDFRQADIDTQLEALKGWYGANLVTSYKRSDGYDSQHNLEYITFLPKYYFLGLSSGASNGNNSSPADYNDGRGLPQTIGWQDFNNGGANGTFDPLAE